MSNKALRNAVLFFMKMNTLPKLMNLISFLKPDRYQWIFWAIAIILSCREDTKTPELVPDLAGKFKNPVLHSAPDPWVFQKDEWYYITHTTGHNLILYRTNEVSAISEADMKVIWSPPFSGMNSKNIWAPELHFIDGKWYFYYAADDGNNINHRMWVLENTSADPLTGTWVNKGEVELPDDKWAIDGTIFRLNGQLYFLWSGWEGDTNIRQNIYIAKMTNPWTAEGVRVRLSKPELNWELNGGSPAINEAPEFLQHNNKIFITFSASGCWTDDYSLGLLSADISSDPMDPASWTKSQQPVFVKNTSAQAFGPGHNSFFKSKDGLEDWIVYHANASSGDGCGDKRSMRMQKFIWTEKGMPDFGSPVALGEPVDMPAGEN
jgi:GH43 family beta-xylosidase